MKNEFEEIKKLFLKKGGYVRTKDIVEAGINKYHLYQMLDLGMIAKVKRGLYLWYDNYNYGNELVEVSKIVHNGVICLLSALDYYEIGTYSPWQHHVAIHRSSHRPSIPKYPPIQIFYFSTTQFETGIEDIDIEGNKVKIYDLEKTLCDCFRFRDEVGLDIVKEALKEYVKRKDRDINKLLKYAEITNVSGLLKTYLEVLI